MKKFLVIVKSIPLLLSVVIISIALAVTGRIGRDFGYRNYEFSAGDSYIGLVCEGLHDGVLPWDAPTEVVTVEEEVVAPKVVELPEGYVSAVEEAALREIPVSEVITERQEQSKGTFVFADALPEGVNSAVLEATDYGNCDPIRLTPEDVSFAPLNSTVFRENGDFYRQIPAESVEYFNNALFIGDSRTYGLVEHGSLDENATFFARESMSIYDLDEMTMEPIVPGGFLPEQTLENLLSQNSYGKVYICVGVNELGTGNTVTFYNAYVSLIEKIRHYQPEAIIYVQGIMHVSEKKGSKDVTYNNTNIIDKNKAIATLANGHDIFYLDMNETVCDGNGNLRSDLTNDGVHLEAQYYVIWEDYIKAHVIYRNEKDR